MAFFKLQDSPQVFQLTEQGLKGFGTPEELTAAGGDFSQVQTLTTPFLKGLNEKTIFDLRTGQGFASPEQFFAAGGRQDFSNIAVPSEISEDLFMAKNTLSLPPVSSLSNIFQARLDSLAGVLPALDIQREKALTELKKTGGELGQALAGGSRADIFGEALAKTGAPAVSEELRPIRERAGQLSNEIRTLQNTIEQDIRKELSGQIITESQVQARVAQRANEIIKPRQLELANVLTQQQILEGRLADARELAIQAVNFELADRQDNLERLKFFYNQNKDVLEDIDAKRANLIKQQIEFQDFFIEELQNEKKEVIDLMVKNPQARIKTTDTLEEATEKMRISGVSAFELREVGGNLYRVDKNTGRAELVVGGRAAEKTVPFSIGAAEAGIVGLPISQAEKILIDKALNEKLTDKERAKASVRAKILKQLGDEDDKDDLLKDREFAIDALLSIKAHQVLSRDEISLIVDDLIRSQFKEPGIRDIGFKETPGLITSGIKRLFGR